MTIDGALSVLVNLEKEMKGYQFEAESSERRVNLSFALLALNALEAYLQGQQGVAQLQFETLAEELAARQHSRNLRSCS